MPSVDEIVTYWKRHESECGLGTDWSEAHERCWRCGYVRHLERCHIIPKALGGPDKPSNLVLLCLQCHREAPNINDSEYMWKWIRATAASQYDTYWTLRGVEEFRRMFGREPFDQIADLVSKDEAMELYRRTHGRTIIHGGEAGTNPATIACIFAEMEKEFLANKGLVRTGDPLTARQSAQP